MESSEFITSEKLSTCTTFEKSLTFIASKKSICIKQLSNDCIVLYRIFLDFITLHCTIINSHYVSIPANDLATEFALYCGRPINMEISFLQLCINL